MSDDLFGNISSDEDEVISKQEDNNQKPESAELDKAKAAQLLLDELSEDSDNSDEYIQPANGKVTNLSLDDEDEEDGEQVFDKDDSTAKIGKSMASNSVPRKKLSDAINRKKNILFSEMNVTPRHVSLDKDSSNPFFVKLPKFLKIATDVFDPETYDAEAERSKYEAASAVVRWTSDPSNSQHILSNAALVQYDDGSFEFVVGDNVFNAKMASAENCFIFEQAKCTQIEKRHPNAYKNKGIGVTSQEEKSLAPCICLVCCGPINNRFIFEPTSLDSAAHHRIHFNVRNQDVNQQEKKIGTMDLEKLQETQAINQKQFEKLDEKRRSVAKQKKRAAESQPRRFVAHHRPYMSSQYLEGDEYEDDFYDDEEEDEGKLVERPKKVPPSAQKKPKKRRSDSDDDEGESVGRDGEDMSVDDENDHGSDLDDFIEQDNDDGDDDEDAEALDEGSAADGDSEEDEDEEEAEAEDEEDEDDEESGMSGEDDEEEEDVKKKSKKGKDSRKDKKKDKKHTKSESKKYKKDKLKKGKKVEKKDESDEDIAVDRSESKKRKRSKDSEDDEQGEKNFAQAEPTEKLTELAKEDALRSEEDEDEEVIVHQSKKQRKVLLDSDEDE